MTFRPILTAVALASLAFAAQSQTPVVIYSLGDSLSDAGTYAPTTRLGVPDSGRFTTNPGLVWTEYLANSLGLTSTPAIVNQFGQATRTAVEGGTNYAQGGSRVSAPNPGVAAWVTQDPVSSQIDRLLVNTGGKIRPNALVTVWAGANDLLAGLAAANAAGFTPTSVGQALAGAQTAATDLKAQIQRLQAAGAQYIVVNTVPDLGLTPFGASLGQAGAAFSSNLTTTFNTQLLQSLQGQNVMVFDSNKLLADITSRPAAYGFTSATATTVPVCGAASSLTCVNPPNAATSFFADGVHPTAAAHQIVAQASLSHLRAPGQIASLAVTAMKSAELQAQALEPRLSGLALGRASTQGGRDARAVGNFELFTSVQAGSVDESSAGVRMGSDLSARQLSLGGDFKITTNALVGAVLSSGRGDLDFGQNTGGAKTRLTSIGLYGTWAPDPQWYVNAAISQGQLDFNDIRRDAQLGAAGLVVSSKGETEGRQSALRVGGGYLVKASNFTGGPTLALTHESVKVNGYAESAGPLAMSYGDTKYTRQRLSLGFQAAFDMGSFKPYASISLEQDLNKDPVKVSLGSYEGNRLNVDTTRPDRSYGLVNLGVRGALTNTVGWNVGYTGAIGYGAGSASALHAGLQMRF